LIDLDELIVRETGMEIDEIFEKFGESHFRKLEYQAVAKLENKEGKQVIALGGGSYCQDEIQALLNSSSTAFTVYLKYSPEFLVERLINEKNHRPIIKAEQDLLGFVKGHLTTREAYYNAADLVLIDETDVNKICDQISSYLQYQDQKLSTI